MYFNIPSMKSPPMTTPAARHDWPPAQSAAARGGRTAGGADGGVAGGASACARAASGDKPTSIARRFPAPTLLNRLAAILFRFMGSPSCRVFGHPHDSLRETCGLHVSRYKGRVPRRG